MSQKHWFSGDHFVSVYVHVFEMREQAYPPFNKQGTAFFACVRAFICVHMSCANL